MALLHYAYDTIRVGSEILFSEGLCRVVASHFICNANRLTGFCMGDPLLGSATKQTIIYFCLLVCICLLQES